LDGLHPRPRRAGAQPQEHRRGHPAQPAGGDHRPVGLGQVQPGLRHALRGRAAALRGEPQLLRPPVPGPDGEARRGFHRGALPRHLHRAEVHPPQPALHRGHRDGDLRLPAPALGQHRRAPLHGVRPGHPPAEPGGDRQPDRAGGRGPAPADPCAAGARPQGRVPRPLPAGAQAGLSARARGRQGAAPGGGGAGPGQDLQARHRRGGGPPGHQGGHPRPPLRIGGDRAEPGRRAGARAHRGRARRGAPAQPALRLPRARHQRGGAGAAPLLLQQPLWRLPLLFGHRPSDGAGPGAGGGGPGPQPARRGHRHHGGRQRRGPRRDLDPQGPGPGGAEPGLQPGHALEGPQGRPPPGDPPRDHRRDPLPRPGPPGQGFLGVQQPLGGDHPQPGAPLPPDPEPIHPRVDREVHEQPALRGLRRPAPQARVPGRDCGRAQHHGAVRRQHPRRPGLRGGPGTGAHGDAHRRAHPQGGARAPGLPGERGAGLPQPGARRGHPVRRRGPAHPPGHADRQPAHGRALHPGRAQHRPAPAGQRAAHPDPGAPAGPGQHGHRGGARPGHHPGGGRGAGPGPRRGHPRRRSGQPGHAGPDHGEPPLRHRALPQGRPPHPRARGAAAGQRPVAGGGGPARQQPQAHRPAHPPGRLHLRYRRLGQRQVHGHQRDPLQAAGPGTHGHARAAHAPGARPVRRAARIQDARLRAGALLLQREGRTLRGLPGGRHPQDRDALPPRRLRALRGVQGEALQQRDPGGALQGALHRRRAGDDRGGGRGLLRGHPPAGQPPADPAGGGPGLHPPGPAGHHPLRRRGPAGEAGRRAGQAGHGPHHLHPGRAHHGPALRGHPTTWM